MHLTRLTAGKTPTTLDPIIRVLLSHPPDTRWITPMFQCLPSTYYRGGRDEQLRYFLSTSGVSIRFASWSGFGTNSAEWIADGLFPRQGVFSANLDQGAVSVQGQPPTPPLDEFHSCGTCHSGMCLKNSNGEEYSLRSRPRGGVVQVLGRRLPGS